VAGADVGKGKATHVCGIAFGKTMSWSCFPAQISACYRYIRVVIQAAFLMSFRFHMLRLLGFAKGRSRGVRDVYKFIQYRSLRWAAKAVGDVPCR